MAVGINFNPFDSNLIWLSVKFAFDRFLINLSLFFVREEVDSFLRSLRFLVFICVFVIFDFPFLLFFLSVLAVLEHSVNRHVYFSTSLLFTTSFNVDSSVGTFSASIPSIAARFFTLMSADSGLGLDLLFKPLSGVPFRRVLPFSLRNLIFCFSRRR